jgi:cobalamin synthase
MIGLILGGLWWAAEGPMGPLPAAALVVAADLVVTGALHFDGLLDSADGLLPHLRPERRLAVMADPHAGAFAVAVGASALLLRTAALAGFDAVRPWLLVVLWCLSRTAMAVTALTGRYARSHGLASAFLAEPASPSAGAPAAPAPTGSEPSPGDATARPAPSRPAPIPGDASAPPAPPKPAPIPGDASAPPAPPKPAPLLGDASAPPAPPKPAPNVRVWLLPAAIGAVLSLGLAVAGDPKSVVALVAAGLAAAGVAWLARRRIGGFTGDTLGAAGVVSETVGLLTAVAVLHR